MTARTLRPLLAVAAIMAEELGWTPSQSLEMQEAFRRVAEGFLVDP